MIKKIILTTISLTMFGCAYRETPPAPIADGIAQFAVNTNTGGVTTTKNNKTAAENATPAGSDEAASPTKITKLSKMNNHDSADTSVQSPAHHNVKPLVAEKPVTDNDTNANDKDSTNVSTSRDGWMIPVKGDVVGKFSQTKKGVDIKSSPGSAIDAASDGKVLYSGNGLKGYGNLIIIRHDNGYLTAYAQNKTNLVKVGQDVKAGDKIAEVGNGGILHFELRKNGKPINPINYIRGE